MSTIDHISRVPVAVRGAQLVSLLLAIPMVIGSVMFSVITPDHRYAAWVTWLFSPVAFAAAAGLLVTLPRLGRGGRPIRRRMLGLLVVVQVYSVVKITVFGEVESIPFLTLALIAFLLVRTHVIHEVDPGRD